MKWLRSVSVIGMTGIRGIGRGQASTLRVSIPSSRPSLVSLARATYATSAEADLKAKLETQIAEETEMAKKNLEGRPAPAIDGFSVATEEAEVRLTKDHDGAALTITFNVNHSVDSEEAEGQQEPEESYMLSRPSFTVEVARDGQKLVFECQLVEPEGEEGDAFSIDEVYLYSGELSEKVYATSGPIMDQSLYDSLMDYLEEMGLDGKFAASLVEFSTHYEHAQYVAMLKRLKDFIK